MRNGRSNLFLFSALKVLLELDVANVFITAISRAKEFKLALSRWHVRGLSEKELNDIERISQIPSAIERRQFIAYRFGF